MWWSWLYTLDALLLLLNGKKRHWLSLVVHVGLGHVGLGHPKTAQLGPSMLMYVNPCFVYFSKHARTLAMGAFWNVTGLSIESQSSVILGYALKNPYADMKFITAVEWKWNMGESGEEVWEMIMSMV